MNTGLGLLLGAAALAVAACDSRQPTPRSPPAPPAPVASGTQASPPATTVTAPTGRSSHANGAQRTDAAGVVDKGDERVVALFEHDAQHGADAGLEAFAANNADGRREHLSMAKRAADSAGADE